jgi:hypothetical protein
MKSSTWESYIRGFCRDHGIRLVTDTYMVAANIEDRIIACPINNPERIGMLPNERARELMGAFVKHEVAHILFSKSNIILFSREELQKPFLMLLTNALEDVRIENRIGEQWPGIQEELLQNSRECIAGTVNMLIESGDKMPLTHLTLGSIFREYLGTGTTNLLQVSDPRFFAIFGKNKEWIERDFRKATCHEDIAELARKMYKLLPEPPKMPMPKLGGREGDLMGKPSGEGPLSALEELRRHLIGAPPRQPNYRWKGKVKNYEGTELVSYSKRCLGPYLRQRTPLRSPSIIQGLKQVISRELLDKKKRKKLVSMKHGKLFSKHLYRTKLNPLKPRTFYQLVQGKEVSPDLFILVDGSGSMRDINKMKTALDIMWNLNQALRDFRKLNYAISFFTTYNKEKGDPVQLTIKPFGGVFNREVAQIIPTTPTDAPMLLRGSNEYEALKFAEKQLACQPGHRKIVIAISDGFPECGQADPWTIQKMARKQIDNMKLKKIEVYGIGLLTNAGNEIYPNFRRVNTETLGTEIVGVIQNLIQKGGEQQ